MKAQKAHLDALVSGSGTVYLLRPLTSTAKRWIEANVGGETQYLGDALAVEHRYILDLIDGMQDSGLVVKYAY